MKYRMKEINKHVLFDIFVGIILCFLILVSFMCNSDVMVAKAQENNFQEQLLQSEEDSLLKESNISLYSTGPRSGNLGVISGAGKNEYSINLLTADLTNVKYIPNANYFLINPSHHENNANLNSSGVCTTVALQLLMGYHNYYSDRRIIPSTYLSSDYGAYNSYPLIYRAMEAGNGCENIGTQDSFFIGLFNHTNNADFPGLGQSINNVKDGGIAFMEENTPASVRNNISLTSGIFSKDIAQSDIDAGNPIVLVMHPFNDEFSFHVVVAYGYAKLDGVDGFLVHYGWGDVITQAWVPASWFAFQMRMSVDTHTHNFVQGNIYDYCYKELDCSICGATKVDHLYTYSDGAIVGTKYSLTSNTLLPDNIDIYDINTASFYEMEINKIGPKAFMNHSEIRDIILPTYVEIIDDLAFAGCVNLVSTDTESVSSLVTIGDYAYAGCTSLGSVEISKKVIKVGEGAFSGCSILTNLSFDNNSILEHIGDRAFANCNIVSVSLPTSLTYLGCEAFDSSVVLSSFLGNRENINLYMPAGSVTQYNDNGWTGFNEIELSTTGPLTVMSGSIIGEFKVPNTFNNREITTIGEDGFANQTELTKITMSSVTTIEARAFSGCEKLENIEFVSQEFTSVIPNQTTSYTNYYYTEHCLISDLVAGYIYTLTFKFNNLTTTTANISDVFTSLGVGENAFEKDLPFQKNFSSSSGTQTITFIPTKMQLATSNKLWCRFIRTSTQQSVSIEISDVNITWGVKTISIYAFNDCEKLSTPGIEYRLLDDDTYAIEGIGNTVASLTFHLSGVLFIPSEYNGKEISAIDNGAFENTQTLKWVFMQTGINVLGANAFKNCSNLINVDIDATSITGIGNYAFYGCENLKRINYPSTLTSVGNYAFFGLSYTADLPDSVTTIGAYAFAEGENSVSFTLPANLVSIGDYAFANKGNLVLIDNGTQLETIGVGAFKNTMLSSLETLPASVVTIGASAFENSEVYYTFAFADDNALTTIGANAFKNCAEISSIVLSSSVTTIGANAFSGCSDLTIYVEYTSKPSGWNSSWNNSNRPVIWGCVLDYKAQVISFVKTSSNPTNYNNISDPTYDNMNFGGWYTTSNFTGDSYDYSDLSSAPNGTLYAKWSSQSSSCIAEGSLITLADGSQKAVEELTGEELLLVWNMETGSFDVAPILFIDVDSRASYEIIELTFADGTSVKVIYEHAFWDFTLNKYVFMREDASQYIGHYFNKQTYDSEGNMTYTAVELIEVDIYTELTIAYSPVTYGHLCYYVNGMLSMPGATEGLINIFEVTSMKYDEESYLEDVEEYGLFTYEEFNETVELPEEVFNAFNGQYLKVALGKGLITWDRIIELLETYGEKF